MMSLPYRIDVTCTNKLCHYEGTVHAADRRVGGEKMVCPECGFKTLKPKSNVDARGFCPMHDTGGGPCNCSIRELYKYSADTRGFCPKQGYRERTGSRPDLIIADDPSRLEEKHGKTCSDFLSSRDMNGEVAIGYCMNENNPKPFEGNCHSIHCPRHWAQAEINEYNWEIK